MLEGGEIGSDEETTIAKKEIKGHYFSEDDD